MEKTKIHLSAEELQLIHNEEWILTKNRVIEKITHAMGQLGMEMQQTASQSKDRFVNELLHSNPKVSRGEKYEGLPYIILDYPRIFAKENILAIRTFFWWGNFCSITLHVRGDYQGSVSKKLMEHYQLFQNQEFYVSFQGNEWNHDLTTRNYHLLNTFTVLEMENAFRNAEFFKLCAKVEFNQWDKMETQLFTCFLMLLTLMEN